MSYTSNMLANVVADAHLLDADQKARAFRTFRNLISKEVVPYTIDPEDGREAKLVGLDAAGVVLLLSQLAAMGVEVGVLREVGASLLRPNPVTGEKPIDAAFAAVRAGKAVNLLVRLEREGVEPARIVTRVRVEGEEPTGAVAAILAARSVEVLATMTVGANARLRPLIEIEAVED